MIGPNTGPTDPLAWCAAHLHTPILSPILGVETYTDKLTPKMVKTVDVYCVEEHSTSAWGRPVNTFSCATCSPKKMCTHDCGMLWPSGWEHWTQNLVFLICRGWVWVLVEALVSLSKILYHKLLCLLNGTLRHISCLLGLAVCWSETPGLESGALNHSSMTRQLC